jgi:tRNA nucleotidyltransferase (CCA-adding enzyme)
MQFIGRFQMGPDDKLNNICKIMDIASVSAERIEEEFRKLFLKSSRPSLGIEWLNKIGRLKEVLPEVYKTIGVPQEPEWHPEGDVYEHTKQALDASAKLEYESEQEKVTLMWAALCHDLGKVTTTKFINGRYRSHGHEIDSEIFATKLLKRITRNHDLLEIVRRLVRHHMQPGQLIKLNSSPAAYKRLALKLAPYTNLSMLTKLMVADRSGRNINKGFPLSEPVPDAQKFLNKIQEFGIEKSIEAPVLQGKDIIDIVNPGPQMGKLLQLAYEIQIEEGIKDKRELKKRIIENK